jgi:hypothetical protein
LGTGLSPSASEERLPEAWVAPAKEPPKLDGRLDDDVWSAAEPIVLGMLEREGKTRPRTEVRLVYAGGMLYVGCQLTEPAIGKLKRGVDTPDGPAYQDDSVELFLSPYPERGYFQMIVSATGAVYDRRDRGDPAGWNSGAKVAVHVAANSWSAEVAIPMASLGVDDDIPPRWRANVYRNRQAGPEGSLQAWSPTFSGDYDVPKRFGQWLFTPDPPWTDQQSQAGPPQGITVERVGQGEAVLLFDLSAIPRGTKIHRAELLCQRRPYDAKTDVALRPTEIYPLAQEHEQGRAPKSGDRPLKLVEPSLRSFELTELVRRWVAGQGVPGLYVKSFPGWQEHATYLDVRYEGERKNVPAQVTGVRVFHRAGQTFITWNDPADSFGEKPVTWGELRDYLRDTDAHRQIRYRVYQHAKPINTNSIQSAKLLAEVEPLSGFNINSWSLERLINQAVFGNEDQGELGVYGPFNGWTKDSPQGGKLVIPRLAIEDGKPVSPGRGLHVHSTTEQQPAYYAVTAVVGGVENLAEFSSANSLTRPVAEAPAEWEPVRQAAGGGFGFDFRGQRHFYVTWVAPPLAPKPMYFNWSVLVPPDCRDPSPVELYFHASGYSYARPPVKFLDRSIQLCPHDFPFSGWYGMNDAVGTLKNPADGVVRPYTVRRIEAFLRWAQEEYPVDRSRVIAVGGDGAALMALYRPEIFAYVLITRFEAQQLDPKVAWRYTQAWGPASPKIEDESGLAQWRWGELDWLLCGKRLPAVVPDDAPRPTVESSAPGFKTELPLFVCRGPSWGRNPDYGHGRGRFYYALKATKNPLHGHWAWGGKLTVPEKFSGLWQGVDIHNTMPVPAITGSSGDKEGEGAGQTNAGYRWYEVEETVDGLQITIAGPQSTFDVTPRRLSKFKIRPGQKIAWEVEAAEVPDWSRAEKPAPKAGEITADRNGQVTLRGLEIVRGYALKIKLTQ